MNHQNSWTGVVAVPLAKFRPRLLAIVLPLATFVVAALVTVSGCKERSPDGKPPLRAFDTPDWAVRGRLLVRMESDEHEVFLLSHLSDKEYDALYYAPKNPDTVRPWRSAVYRYDPRKGILERADAKSWETATGRLCDWRTLRAGGDAWLVVNSNRLQIRGRVVPTKGKYAMISGCLSGGKLVAVASGDGPVKRSIMPFLGGTRPRGQYYHQLFTLPSVIPFGETRPLPLNHEDYPLRLCWAPDGRHVIYCGMHFKRLCIVPVEDEEGQ